MNDAHLHINRLKTDQTHSNWIQEQFSTTVFNTRPIGRNSIEHKTDWKHRNWTREFIIFQNCYVQLVLYLILLCPITMCPISCPSPNILMFDSYNSAIGGRSLSLGRRLERGRSNFVRRGSLKREVHGPRRLHSRECRFVLRNGCYRAANTGRCCRRAIVARRENVKRRFQFCEEYPARARRERVRRAIERASALGRARARESHRRFQDRLSSIRASLRAGVRVHDVHTCATSSCSRGIVTKGESMIRKQNATNKKKLHRENLRSSRVTSLVFQRRAVETLRFPRRESFSSRLPFRQQ